MTSWRCSLSGGDDRDPESDEVLAEQLLRLTSREYLDCVGGLLKERRAAEAAAEEMDDEATSGGGGAAAAAGGNVLQFSELGLSILQEPVSSDVTCYSSVSSGLASYRNR